MAGDSPDRIGSLTVPVGASVVVAAVVVILTVLYAISNQNLENAVIFFAAAATAGATVLTSFYTAQSLKEVLRQRNLRAHQDRLSETMAFARRWNDPQMYHVREVCRAILELKSSGREAEIPDFVAGKETNVGHIFNYFEELAFSKENDLIDSELARNQFEGVVIKLWQALEPWVRQHRTARGRPKIWARMEALYNEWSHR